MKKTFLWRMPSARWVVFAVATSACAVWPGHPSLDASREGYNKCADVGGMVVHNKSRAAVLAMGRVGGVGPGAGSFKLAMIPGLTTDTLMVVPQMTVDFVFTELRPGGGRATYYELKKIALECI